jgi:hypothetical protein
MKRPTLLVALGVGALAVVLASCTKGAQGPVEPTTVPSTTIPASSVLVSDTPDSSNCVTCHTDQASLQALAVEPVQENLNEGEG